MVGQVAPATAVSNPAPQGARYSGVLELLTKAALLGGPLFYVLGRVYAEGYWSALGVSSSVMGVEAEDYIYFGFIVIANGLALVIPRADNTAIWMAPLASVVLLIALGFSVWLFGRVRAWLARKLRRHARRLRAFLLRKKSAVEALGTAGSILSAACAAILAFLLVSGALLFPIVIANSIGKWRAGKVSQELEAGTNEYVQVLVDGEAMGQLVECTDRYCVIFAHGQFTPVPLEAVRWPHHGDHAP